MSTSEKGGSVIRHLMCKVCSIPSDSRRNQRAGRLCFLVCAEDQGKGRPRGSNNLEALRGTVGRRWERWALKCLNGGVRKSKNWKSSQNLPALHKMKRCMGLNKESGKKWGP